MGSLWFFFADPRLRKHALNSAKLNPLGLGNLLKHSAWLPLHPPNWCPRIHYAVQSISRTQGLGVSSVRFAQRVDQSRLTNRANQRVWGLSWSNHTHTHTRTVLQSLPWCSATTIRARCCCNNRRNFKLWDLAKHQLGNSGIKQTSQKMVYAESYAEYVHFVYTCKYIISRYIKYQFSQK